MMEDNHRGSIYNIILCRICQISDNLDLVNTSSRAEEVEETYLDILKFIFNDILWVEDDLISVACKECLKKVTDIAQFKRLCLKTNSERGVISAIFSTQDYTNPHEIKDEEMDNVSDDRSQLTVSPSETKQLPLSQPTKAQTIKYPRKRGYFIKPKKRSIKQEEETPLSPQLFESLEIEETANQQTLPTRRKRRCAKSSKPESKAKCDICGEEKFKNLRELERHIFRHNGTRNYICTICGRKYITNGDLITHAKSHSVELKFECDICNKMFKAVRNVQTHKAIVHMDKKDYKHLCTICGNKFVTAERLKEHVKRHKQIKSYPCELCNKSFVSKGEMLRHAATHTNIRAFKCDLCDIEYKQKEFLIAHKSRKHGIGKFRSRLKQSEKPYQCRLCDAKFKCEINIKPHLKKKHDINCDMKRDFDPTKYYIIVKPTQL